MSTRRNGGIIGPQNRTTSANAPGIWHLDDNQQSVLAKNWPGFIPVSPSAPAVGTVTLGSGTQAAYLTATIPFTQGYNGGNAVTKVTAVSIPGGLTANTSGSSPITISGLTSNTNYTFGVYETNYYGDSPYGYSNPVTTATVPEAPTIGTATLISGTTTANVAFTAPSSNGGATITGYTVKAYVSGVYSGISTSGTTSPITITGLAGSTTYTFRVYATNVFGNGPESSDSNSITTPNIVNIQYLVVAGGAGGGLWTGGGGGAGGLLTGTFVAIPSTIYSVAVGGGGIGAVGSRYVNGSPGTNSSFATYTATGGGGGGTLFGPRNDETGDSGGSGGGGAGYPGLTPAGGAGTSGQGYAGGNGAAADPYSGGGGGGAGGAGGVQTGSGSSGVGGVGGVGFASSITGTSVYYAGGGGGAPTSTAGATGGAGGSSIGGNGGGASQSGSNAVANTGSGGGGCSNGGTAVNGGAGSGGVVILSVPTASYSGVYTGTPTITTSGSNTILTFTGAGSYRA